MMDVSLVHQSHENGFRWLNKDDTGYKPYHYDMIGAKSHFKLDYTLMPYIYKVFKHLLMYWIVVWMYP